MKNMVKYKKLPTFMHAVKSELLGEYEQILSSYLSEE
jgi:hypothetical protein